MTEYWALKIIQVGGSGSASQRGICSEHDIMQMSQSSFVIKNLILSRPFFFSLFPLLLVKPP